MVEKLQIKPYARLITMLGDQLIKNEVIALIELIKNSYDADASIVKIEFKNFNDDYSINEKSQIIITDNGHGMDEHIIKKHWLNPATPEKLIRKNKNKTTPIGRIMQGEKGIGRFAVFKLGKKIKITTRRQKRNKAGDFIEGEGEVNENILLYDFSNYDEEFLEEEGKEKELFLEDLVVEYSTRIPEEKGKFKIGVMNIESFSHGTTIEISNLKTKWSKRKVEQVQKEITKMQPIFSKIQKEDKKKMEIDFEVYIVKDEILLENESIDKLEILLETKPVFKVTNGIYIEEDRKINFLLNGKKVTKEFSDADIQGLSYFRNVIKNQNYRTECGNFEFEFYIFDFAAKEGKFRLESVEKDLIKEHRIYLYRDGIRVLPYGDPKDDWLGIDIARGTERSAALLSNDQIVGCVYITQENNINLKDKTNREGLIEEGKSLEDFINILQIILRYLRANDYDKYLIDKKNRENFPKTLEKYSLELIEEEKRKSKNDPKIQKFLTNFEQHYKRERKALQDRIDKTENLAAVGLSVEAASHDMMLMMRNTLNSIDSLITNLSIEGEVDKEKTLSNVMEIRGSLSFIATQLKDIQILFPSTKSRVKSINVNEIVKKVERLYSRIFKRDGININILEGVAPLVAKTTDAVLLQVFINLFDNALYWTKVENESERKIEIEIDSINNRIIFSDNGPGIKAESIPYIFEAFYSEKGEDGRGLGLYIARQLLDRYDYTIELATSSRDKLLKGATFIIDFVKEEK